MKTKRIILISCFALYSFVLDAQSRRRSNTKPLQTFEAGLVAGVNFAQIDGDYFTGYDKNGWYAGLRASANLSTKTSLNIEMLYSQKGSFIPHGTVVLPASVNDRLIALDYVEVPILLNHKLDTKASSLFVEIGFSYARLFDTEIVESRTRFLGGTIYQDIESEFNNQEINIVVGFGYTFNNRVDIGFRFDQAITKFYVNEEFERPVLGSLKAREVEFLRNYTLAIFGAYRLL